MVVFGKGGGGVTAKILLCVCFTATASRILNEDRWIVGFDYPTNHVG